MLILLPLLLVSCSKNSDVFIPESSTPDFKGNINNFYSAVRKNITGEIFIINSSAENVVTTSNGMRLIFPAHALIDSLQHTINGEVLIKVIQLSTKSDFIRFAQFSNNGSLILDWYKNINIEAFYNGKKLSVSPDKSITVQIPTSSVSQSWKVFNGNYSSTRVFKITPSGFSQIKNAIWKDGGSGSIVEGIEFNSKILSWLCIAKPVGDLLFNQVDVKLPVIYKSFNTMVIALNKTNNVIYSFEDTKELESIFSQKISDFKYLTFLAIADQNNDLYMAEKYYEDFGSNSLVDLNPGKISVADLEKTLSKY